MSNDKKKIIKECEIKNRGYKCEVNVVYEDDTTEESIISYYPDELSFNREEFIGLTKEQAADLFYRKDVAYLRS